LEPGFDLGLRLAPDKIKQCNSQKTAKIKQNQAKSEPGFDLGQRLTPDKVYDSKRER
jgi:hypothetical protein